MSFGESSLERTWTPGGAGANYHYLTLSIEDDVFHKDDTGNLYTQWKQKIMKYTPHQSAVIVQPVNNTGAGKTMSTQLTKTPDLLYNSYTVSSWYGIQANTDCGVTKTSWVNGKALFVNKAMRLKIANQTLFEVDGVIQLALLEFQGVLEDYASLVGFNYTVDQLIEDSKFDVIHYAPWYGFPMQDRPDLAFAIGTIAFHPVTWEQQNRGICELIVNYDGCTQKGRGIYALPIEIQTGAVVSQSSVDFVLATNMIWVSPEERTCLLNGYNEIIFKEYMVIGEHSEGPACNEKKITFDLNAKGPVAHIWMQVQNRNDIDNGNWVKNLDDYGLDYIREWTLITGTTPREDSLPAAFSRTAKVIETFKVGISRALYVISFETNATSRQMTGHQTMTNVEKLQISAIVKAHKCTLDFTAYAAIYNGAYTERGGAGKIWG